MNNLTRFNPFKSLARMDPFAEIDDVFRSMDTRNLFRDADTPLDLRMDITEDDKAYQVRVDVPGVDKDNIEVTVDGNRLTIQAEVKSESTKEKGQRIRSERYLGQSFRSVVLPTEMDETKATATCEHGVLRLTLPKKGNGKARKLKVQ